jgi:hypothetical protein
MILALAGCVIGLLLLAPAASAGQAVISFVAPSPPDGASVGVDVDFAFTINRTAKSVPALLCELSGPTASSGSCDPVTSIERKLSASGVSYTDLAAGTYTLTVTPASGGIDPVSTTFTVVPIHTVAVTVVGDLLNRIGIVSVEPDPGAVVCLSASTCSRELADGAFVRVELGNSSPFTYMCGGSTDPVAAVEVSGIFSGVCEEAALTADYAVSVETSAT